MPSDAELLSRILAVPTRARNGETGGLILAVPSLCRADPAHRRDYGGVAGYGETQIVGAYLPFGNEPPVVTLLRLLNAESRR